MRPLRVRFQRAIVPRRRFTWTLLGVSLAVAGVEAVAGWQSWQAWQRLPRETGAFAYACAAAVPAVPDTTARHVAATMQAEFDAIVRTAGFDTGGALQAVENAATPGVRVLSIDVLPAEDRVIVELIAPDLPAVLAWLTAVDASAFDARWSLLRLQAVAAGGVVASVAAQSPRR